MADDGEAGRPGEEQARPDGTDRAPRALRPEQASAGAELAALRALVVLSAGVVERLERGCQVVGARPEALARWEGEGGSLGASRTA